MKSQVKAINISYFVSTHSSSQRMMKARPFIEIGRTLSQPTFKNFKIIGFASHIAFALHVPLDDDLDIDSFDLYDDDIGSFDLDDGNGIAPVSIPSERPQLGSRLSSSIDDSHVLAVFSFIDKHDINVVTNDSIPSKSADGLGSRLLSLADDLFDDDDGITPVLIPSEPSRLGSRFPAASDDLFDEDNGITPVSIPSEPSCSIGSPFPASADDHFEDDVGITPVSIPSWPSPLGSGLSSSADDLFEQDNGINTDDSISNKSADGLGSLLLSSAGNVFEDDNDGSTPVSIPSEPP
jgi:hypothetical protein